MNPAGLCGMNSIKERWLMDGTDNSLAVDTHCLNRIMHPNVDVWKRCHFCRVIETHGVACADIVAGKNIRISQQNNFFSMISGE